MSAQQPESATGQDELLKRALIQIKKLRARVQALEDERRDGPRQPADAIAIVGMGCRFPGGVDSPAAFWQLLTAGRDAIIEVPPDRWDAEVYYDPDGARFGTMVTRWGGFVPDIDRFDRRLFGISRGEADAMDPQQRMLLEVAWESLEDAGIGPERVRGSKTGVFVGLCNVDYLRLIAGAPPRGATGTAQSIVANRLSYQFDLRGPSMVVDTACSSSLVAVALACDSLTSGSADVALAGGVNAVLAPDLTVAFSKAKMLSPSGRCKTFDARGEGYARGEGCGLVVLKRLADARADGDPIRAVIRAVGCNQDGRSNGLTAPSSRAQSELIRDVLRRAGVAAHEVSYIEAHGTGTPLGDPIEVEALTATYGQPRRADERCALGAVKSNIGHLESAAGIAGLIKVVLCLQHRAIAPNVHFEVLNPNIDLTHTPFFIPTELEPWPSERAPRLAAVSSFGFGGTNAHAVLEEAPPHDSIDDSPDESAGAASARPQVLSMSAANPQALSALASRHRAYLDAHPDCDFGDVAHTANISRAALAHRAAFVAVSRAELGERLAACTESIHAPAGDGGARRPAWLHYGAIARNARPRIGFLYTGQGAQYPGMGAALYRAYPVFHRALEQCQELARPYLERPLLDVMFSEETAPADGAGALDQTRYTQPALFAFEYAMTELWRSFGVEPAAVIGHSVGEMAAACAAGVFSLADGLRLTCERGRLLHSAPGHGGMALVRATPDEVTDMLAPGVEIAAINGVDYTVISGDHDALAGVLKRCEEAFFYVQPLRTSHAFHSALMEPVLEPFHALASRDVTYAAPRIPMVSCTTGRLLAAGEVPDADHWRRHIRQPTLFHASITALLDSGVTALLEVGPHFVLGDLGKRSAKAAGRGREHLWLSSARRDRDSWQPLLDAVAQLFAHGVAIDWAGLAADSPRRRLHLPTYPFQRQRAWLDPADLRTFTPPDSL